MLALNRSQAGRKALQQLTESALCIGRHGSLPDYSSPQSLQGRGDGKPNCRTRLVKTWPTEEAAISHPKALREMVERANRHSHPSEKDWRG